MAEPCATNSPLARKNAAAILHRLAQVSQIAVSEALNVSEATVSRLKSEQVESFTAFLAALELKVVAASAECYEPEYIEHLRYFARVGIAKDTGEAPKSPLTFEADE